jgi:hypothetical protein
LSDVVLVWREVSRTSVTSTERFFGIKPAKPSKPSNPQGNSNLSSTTVLTSVLGVLVAVDRGVAVDSTLAVFAAAILLLFAIIWLDELPVLLFWACADKTVITANPKISALFLAIPGKFINLIIIVLLFLWFQRQ